MEMIGNWYAIVTDRKFIAVVDDEPDLAYLFKVALSDNGFNIIAFTDPVAALAHVQHDHAKYKLVLSVVKLSNTLLDYSCKPELSE